MVFGGNKLRSRNKPKLPPELRGGHIVSGWYEDEKEIDHDREEFHSEGDKTSGQVTSGIGCSGREKNTCKEDAESLT